VPLTSLVDGSEPFVDALTTAPDGRIWAVGETSDPPTTASPNNGQNTEPLVLVNGA
jgi:hypothetical protein